VASARTGMNCKNDHLGERTEWSRALRALRRFRVFFLTILIGFPEMRYSMTKKMKRWDKVPACEGEKLWARSSIKYNLSLNQKNHSLTYFSATSPFISRRIPMSFSNLFMDLDLTLSVVFHFLRSVPGSPRECLLGRNSVTQAMKCDLLIVSLPDIEFSAAFLSGGHDCRWTKRRFQKIDESILTCP
jgi:hypothetical protein